MQKDIKFISLNVNGLNNPIKRKKVMNVMKKERAQIIYLQETHLSRQDNEKLKMFGYTRLYYSTFKHTSKRGVTILIHNSVQFECQKEISDQKGTYIILKGKLDNQMVTMVNVYAPPKSKIFFFRNLINKIVTEMDGILIWGGDLNILMNNKLDTTNKNKQNNPIVKKIKLYFEEFGLIDVWRELNPKKTDFTHYSAPNNTYSRIDYFFLNKIDLYRVQVCKIEESSLSDHSMLSLKLNLNIRTRNTLWRLNVGTLNNKTLKEEIKEDIARYVEENDNGEVNPTILWDALKAVIRGKLIAKTAAIKKIRHEKYEKEKYKLQNLEKQHKMNPKNDLLIAIQEVRRNIDKLLSTEIEKKSKLIKQSYCELGPKATRLLARKLKKQQTERTIFKLKDQTTNRFIYEPSEIEQLFKNYYECLYSQPPSINNEQIQSFLEKLDLPTIGEKQNDILTKPITKKEIEKAFGHLKTNKTPGSDGLPGEWYKTFKTEIISLLETSFNYTLNHGVLPPSWNDAIITVIPKKKDSLTCADFRPISILNVDYKIYTSIIARRYEQFIGDIIDEDQAGFIRGRQTKDNIRRSLHIIDQIRCKKAGAVLVGLDAEKAFDTVSWAFLYQVLQRFGFNKKAIQCIQTLYQQPTARIKINGNLTESIHLKRSARQGCSLSPTLFAIFIEPLAQYIRQHKDIKGIQIGEESHVIGLFADDVICYLQEPETSLPILINSLDLYGLYSGYKLNMAKTQILTFNYSPSKMIREKYSWNWSAESMSYLGVKITKNLDKLYDKNIKKIDQEIRTDIDRWGTLILDFSSKIEIIKMNILPRLLYIFQALPIEIPEKQFQLWNKLVSRFLWNGRRPRIKLEKLQLGKDKGGMALPNFKDYYLAAQICPIVNWCDLHYESKWKNIEKAILGREPASIIGDLNTIKDNLDTIDAVTRFTLEKWLYVAKKYKLEGELPLIQWPAYTKNFNPNMYDIKFKEWTIKGITAMTKLIKDGSFKSFQQLKEEFELENQDHFRYLQLRDFYNKNVKSKVNLNNNAIIQMLIGIYNSKKYKIISSLYKGLMESKDCNTSGIKLKWEKELTLTISDEDWTNIWKTQQSTTMSRPWREHCWKNIIRFFITPNLTSKYRFGEQQCWRQCGGLRVHHSHIFWLCPQIIPFWNNVHMEIERILGYAIPKTSLVLYLGLIKNVVSKEDLYLMKILIAACKKAITKKWCKPAIPTCKEWKSLVKDIFETELLTHRLRTQEEQCQEKWIKWTTYTSTTDMD